MTAVTKVLVIDDIPGFLEEITSILEPAYIVETCSSPLQAIERVTSGHYALVITTLVIKELDGFEIIRRIRGSGNPVPILMVTGYGNQNTAVEASRLGANDYLAKPVNARELRERIKRLLEAPETAFTFITGDPVTEELLQTAKKVAKTSVRVLIQGETGTGKELIANLLHRYSGRAENPFIAVNCAAMPASLIESELFGHVKGAFTGAVEERSGRLEEAGEGTLFLDEVGELGIAVQSKLLRVLQEGDYYRVGGNQRFKLKARVIAASNRDLVQEVREGRFRKDLYYRLNVITLKIRPLRERKEDIRLLIERFTERFTQENQEPIRFHKTAWRLLETYDWPGNVRELEHCIERLSILYPGREVTAEELFELEVDPVSKKETSSYKEALEIFQRKYFRALLQQTGYHLTQAAVLAQMDKGQFHRMVVRLGIHHPASGA